MLTNISISHLVQVGHLQYLNISPSSGRAPPGALRLSYPPRVDFLLPSLTIWPPEQDPEYETHTVVVRRATSVLIHLSPDEIFDVALPQTLWFYGLQTKDEYWNIRKGMSARPVGSTLLAFLFEYSGDLLTQCRMPHTWFSSWFTFPFPPYDEERESKIFWNRPLPQEYTPVDLWAKVQRRLYYSMFIHNPWQISEEALEVNFSLVWKFNHYRCVESMFSDHTYPAKCPKCEVCPLPSCGKDPKHHYLVDHHQGLQVLSSKGDCRKLLFQCSRWQAPSLHFISRNSLAFFEAWAC